MRTDDNSAHAPVAEEDAETVSGDGGAGEAANYIRSNLIELSHMAHRHGLGLLCHLLNMALLEAGEILRLRAK